MRLCLLQPPRPGGRGTNLLPPVGLLYLASALERAGHSVSLVDASQRKLQGERLIEAVKSKDPEILMVSAFTSDVATLREELPGLRESLPRETQFWLGGPHASCRGPDAFEDLPWFDAAFMGEAEESAPRALAALPREEEIDGVIWRSSPVDREPAIIDDLSTLPLPAWHLAPPGDYRGLPNGVILKRLPYAPIITTRGCPYHCTFCAGFRVTGRRIRHRPMLMVWEEVELLSKKYGVREIHIEDDNFTFDRDYALSFCRKALESGTRVLFSTPNGVRLDKLDPELLGMMRRAGWYVVHCGIESGSDRILESVRKSTDTASMSSAIRMIRSSGLPVAGYFILGLPGETREDIEKTIAFSSGIGLSWAHFATFLPIPGSEAGDAYILEHGIPGGSWESFHNTACAAPPEGLSALELKKLQRKAFLSFYLRPGPLFRSFSLLFHRGVSSRLAQRAFAYLLEPQAHGGGERHDSR